MSAKLPPAGIVRKAAHPVDASGGIASAGASVTLRVDMDALGPVKIHDVDEARHQMIEVARQLETEGSIGLGGTGGDRYVS
ncbi:MAG: hypothetical protein KJZ70_09320 [Bryobacterales bacterium]|nr:hypothetical protein [Bryobacterales bacterium]